MQPQIIETKKISKNCAPFTDWINKLKNKEIDHAKDIDVVMPIYNLIEYSDNYSKTSRILQLYYRDEPALNNNSVIIDFSADNNNKASLNLNKK